MKSAIAFLSRIPGPERISTAPIRLALLHALSLLSLTARTHNGCTQRRLFLSPSIHWFRYVNGSLWPEWPESDSWKQLCVACCPVWWGVSWRTWTKTNHLIKYIRISVLLNTQKNKTFVQIKWAAPRNNHQSINQHLWDCRQTFKSVKCSTDHLSSMDCLCSMDQCWYFHVTKKQSLKFSLCSSGLLFMLKSSTCSNHSESSNQIEKKNSC